MSTTPATTRVHLLISGQVQGVAFRESTRNLAERLGLAGWVRNLSDGRVEAVFEGPAAEVARVVAWCRQGPPAALVESVERTVERPTGEGGFRVRSSSFLREAR